MGTPSTPIQLDSTGTPSTLAIDSTSTPTLNTNTDWFDEHTDSLITTIHRFKSQIAMFDCHVCLLPHKVPEIITDGLLWTSINLARENAGQKMAIGVGWYGGGGGGGVFPAPMGALVPLIKIWYSRFFCNELAHWFLKSQPGLLQLYQGLNTLIQIVLSKNIVDQFKVVQTKISFSTISTSSIVHVAYHHSSST